MGVKNLERFNLALLGRWRWRCIKEGGEIWLEMLRLKYGQKFENLSNGVEVARCLVGSHWWKDISNLGSFGYPGDWFREGLVKKLGCGDKTRFWEDIWVGTISLKMLFSRLFLISEQKTKCIAECGA